MYITEINTSHKYVVIHIILQPETILSVWIVDIKSSYNFLKKPPFYTLFLISCEDRFNYKKWYFYLHYSQNISVDMSHNNKVWQGQNGAHVEVKEQLIQLAQLASWFIVTRSIYWAESDTDFMNEWVGEHVHEFMIYEKCME